MAFGNTDAMPEGGSRGKASALHALAGGPGRALAGVVSRFEDAIGLTPTHASRFAPETARELRRERVALTIANFRTMAVCNIAVALIIGPYFWGRGADLLIAVWTGVMLLLNGYTLWHQSRRDPNRPLSGSARSARVVIQQAGIMAALYSCAPFFLIPITEGPESILIAGLAAGTLVIGPYVVYPIPRAAMAWIVISATFNTLSFGLSGEPVFMLAAFFGLVMAGGVGRACVTQAVRLTEQFADRERLREKQDVIALLLREYEDDSSAWLWQCDASGRLTRVPPALVALLPDTARRTQGAEGDGIGNHINVVLDCVTGEARNGMARRLRRLLARREPFHDLMLPIVTRADDDRTETRWLRVRGKPVHEPDGRFAGFRGIASDVTETKIAEDRIRFLATHDALTGLPNRTTFAERVDAWAAVARPFACLHLDLDRFKLVNDTLGHVAGDALLVAVAGRLRETVEAAHPEAICARVGGDEFMCALPLARSERGSATDDATACALAAAILEVIARPFDLEAGTATIGVSIGYAVSPDDAPDLTDMPVRADLALYRSKQEGRNRFARWVEGMDGGVEDRKRLEVDLRGAVARGEMHLAYQPVIGLEDGRMTGVEALLRWTHPERGFVGPDRFIPIAEESGTIVAIGAWVLEEACREAASWSNALDIAVNVSPRQMLHSDFVETVKATLAKTGLEPRRLELELTEGILVDDKDAALAVMRRLKALGVRVVLDDFGTGYASLSYLRAFPFDKIKIDRAFISAMEEGDPAPAALVNAIVDLARTLGMKTTAEGIEETSQADGLRSMGCDTGQGYLFSRPVPARDLSSLSTLARERGGEVDEKRLMA